MEPLRSVAKSNLVKTSRLIGWEVEGRIGEYLADPRADQRLADTRLSKRIADVLGPHDFCVVPSDNHPGGRAAIAGDLSVDVEIRQLAGSTFQPSRPHPIAGTPCA
jgi:hypothetical protein